MNEDTRRLLVFIKGELYSISWDIAHSSGMSVDSKAFIVLQATALVVKDNIKWSHD